MRWLYARVCCKWVNHKIIVDLISLLTKKFAGDVLDWKTSHFPYKRLQVKLNVIMPVGSLRSSQFCMRLRSQRARIKIKQKKFFVGVFEKHRLQ